MLLPGDLRARQPKRYHLLPTHQDADTESVECLPQLLYIIDKCLIKKIVY